MAAFDFPNAPTLGQGYNGYTWDGEKWTLPSAVSGGGAPPSDGLPVMNGVAAPGNQTAYSRGDHIHPSDTTRLPIAGGTITGALTINGTLRPNGNVVINNTQPTLQLDSNGSDQPRFIWGTMLNKNRWLIQVGNPDHEGGGNGGSNFSIDRYNDAGAWIEAALFINRSTGNASIAKNLAIGGATTITGQLNVSSGRIVSNNGSVGGSIGVWDQSSYCFAFWNYGPYMAFGSADGNAGPSTIFMNTSSTGMAVYYGQAYKPGGGVWGAALDFRTMNVKEEYTQGLEAIKALKPVRYTFKGNDTPAEFKPSKFSMPQRDADDNIVEEKEIPAAPYGNSPTFGAARDQREFIGLVGQEAEVSMPETVSKLSRWIDGRLVDNCRDFDASPIIYALVNAVKELAARVEELEAQRDAV